MKGPAFRWQPLLPRMRFAALAILLVFHPGQASASSLEVGVENVNGGAFAARTAVASACTSDLHETIVGDLTGGTFTACSTLTSEAGLTSGTTNFTAGDLVILRNGFLVAEGASLMVEIDRALYPDAWVQDDTPDGEIAYTAQFYIDPSSLNLDASSRFYHLLAFDAGNSPELRVGVKFNDGLAEKRLFLEAFEDHGAIVSTEGSEELALPNGWTPIYVGWAAGSTGDGSAYICVGSESNCSNLSGLDNDTGAIDFVRWGAVDVPSDSDLGNLDMDDFSSGLFDDGFESGSASAWSAAFDGQP